MHTMSNLNKFRDSYQVLEKNPQLCFLKKKGWKTHKKCLNKFFWFKILTTNTLSINLHKIYQFDKNQIPYCNVKSFKSENFDNFGPLIKHGTHWINFTILNFIGEKIRYSRCLYKIWTKIILFDMKEKKHI